MLHVVNRFNRIYKYSLCTEKVLANEWLLAPNYQLIVLRASTTKNLVPILYSEGEKQACTLKNGTKWTNPGSIENLSRSSKR